MVYLSPSTTVGSESWHPGWEQRLEVASSDVRQFSQGVSHLAVSDLCFLHAEHRRCRLPSGVGGQGDD